MSQKRFEKLRQEQINTFHKKVVTELNERLIPIIDDVDTIIFGGNIIRAKELLKRKDFDYRLKEKISNDLIVTSDVGDTGLREAMKQIPSILKEHELTEEKKVWDSFLKLLVRGNQKAIYGFEEIKSAIEQGILEVLLILNNFQEIYCYGGNIRKVVFFHPETEHGQMLKSFGGIAGIKRY